MIRLTIPKRCPSIQGHNVDKRLTEWRGLICEVLREQGFIESGYNSYEEGIRQFVLSHLNGPCCLEMEFSLRATKHVTDLDNMLLFIMACFRTEMTPEAEEIEKEFATRPWFYHSALGFPGNLDFWKVRALRRDGAVEDFTEVRVRRLEDNEASHTDE